MEGRVVGLYIFLVDGMVDSLEGGKGDRCQEVI